MQGDIDILIASSHLSDGLNILYRADCERINKLDKTSRVHYAHKRNKALIEIHTRFAALNTREEEKILDRWLYKAYVRNTIRKEVFYVDFPSLLEMLNGLILLTYIYHQLGDHGRKPRERRTRILSQSAKAWRSQLTVV